MLNSCSWIMDNDEPCGNICEGKTAFCSSHNRQLRRESSNEKKSIEKRNSQIAKAQKRNQEPRKLPSKVSEKRKELNNEYAKLNSEFKREHPICEAKVNQYCTHYSSEVHHKRGRGEYFLDTSTWLAVCRTCHIFITDNPKEAMQRGFSESRLATTEPHKI